MSSSQLDVTDRDDHFALRVSCLSKAFGATQALDDVSLEVRWGEVHALVGQNGSGKSTLVKILAGVHDPDLGTAFVGDQPIRLGHAQSAYQVGVRFVHQDLGLVTSQNTLDNLALGFGYRTGPLGRIHWSRERQAAEKAIGNLGHHFDVSVPLDQLTAVERTTVAIARAMQSWEGERFLLVLDEPTATMPGHEVERVLGLLRRVRDLGAAVLLVTHHLEEVFAVADSVTVLRDGRRAGTVHVATTTRREVVEMLTGVWTGVAAPVTPPSAECPVLTATGVSGKVLRNFDVSIRAGEVVGIAGIDGSGRDEMGALLFGSSRRTGVIEVNGEALAGGRPDEAVRRGMGYVPADRRNEGLLSGLNLRENLCLADLRKNASRWRVRGRSERADTQGWIERLQIRAAGTEVSVETLSGGNQQKVVLGKWLRLNPKVLVLDEPTQGVDIGAKAEIHRLIAETASSGGAVIICSSDEEELAQTCNRVLILRNGHVAAELCAPGISAAAIVQETLREQPGSVDDAPQEERSA